MIRVVTPQMALRHNTPNVPNHRSHARIGIHNPNPGPGMICGKYPEHLIRKSLPDLPDAAQIQFNFREPFQVVQQSPGLGAGHVFGLQLSSNKQV